MTDAPEMVTERDAVLRERAAFVAGYLCVLTGGGMVMHSAHDDAKAQRLAAERLPLPKVTRPRAVNDPHAGGDRILWSIDEESGSLMVAFLDSPQYSGRYPAHGGGMYASSQRLRVWADLLANPTEEVDADA